MAQRCKVCAMPERHEIDMGLVQGTVTAGAVARQYGLTESSVHRHKANHLPKMLATLSTRVQALEADQILGQIISLYERALKSLDDAESMANDSDRAKAIPAMLRETRATLESMAKVSVALNDARLTETVQVENTLEREITEALARRRTVDAVATVGPGENTGATGTSGAHDVVVPALAPGDPVVAEADVVVG